jgi:hypothetical protein
LKENKESDGIFGNISFVEMESQNFIYLFEQTCVEVAKGLWYKGIHFTKSNLGIWTY